MDLTKKTEDYSTILTTLDLYFEKNDLYKHHLGTPSTQTTQNVNIFNYPILPSFYSGQCYSRPSNYSTNSSKSSNNTVSIVTILILTFLGLFLGLITVCYDEYIKFNLSRINSLMKKVQSDDVKNKYKIWKKRYVQRTFYNFVIKCSMIVSFLVLILSTCFQLEFLIYTSIISFGIGGLLLTFRILTNNPIKEMVAFDNMYRALKN